MVVTVVVLDANELQRDWLCTGPKYQLIRHRPFYPPIEVCVPAAVIEELVANHARAASEAQASLEAAERKLGRLGVKTSVAAGDSLDYRSYLLSRFDEVLGITVLEWPTVSHRELVARAVSRTPPFDARGSGYRDALIWTDVLKLAASGRHVVLVSHDGAFADSGGTGLAAPLAAEVRDLPGRVELIREFGQWLLSQVPWQVADLGDAVLHSRRSEFDEWLTQSDFLTEVEPRPEDLGFQRSPYRVSVEDVQWTDTVHLDSRQVPDGVALDEYDIRVDVEFEAEISEGTRIEDEWTVLSADVPGRITVHGRAPMAMRVGVLYDDEQWSVEELAWRRVDAVGPGHSTQPEVGDDQLRLFDEHGEPAAGRSSGDGADGS